MSALDPWIGAFIAAQLACKVRTEVKDYDLNPYTTVIKHLITGEYYENGALPYNYSKQRL